MRPHHQTPYHRASLDIIPGRVNGDERGRSGLPPGSWFALGSGVRLIPDTQNLKRERINVMSSIQGVVLSSVEQYRSEVLRLPRLTRSEESELVNRARNGDTQAKEALIQSCLGYVACVAYRYVCYLQHDDYLDLVSVGNLAIVECFEKALTIDNPVAYLLGVAKLAVKAYCCKHSGLITHQRGQPFVWVDSLDAPLGNGQGCLAEMLATPTQEIQQ